MKPSPTTQREQVREKCPCTSRTERRVCMEKGRGNGKRSTPNGKKKDYVKGKHPRALFTVSKTISEVARTHR